MTETEKYDAIVLGAGQGGMPLASALRRAGRRTAIVEREHVGGTCINEGCTPTKTMVASARVADVVRRAAEYGVHTSAPRVDMTEVRERKRRIVNDFRSSNERRLHDRDVDVLMGQASFTGPHTVEVAMRDGTTRTLEAPVIVINTGERPAEPPVPGLQRVDALNSTTIMELDEVPDHLLIMGGGYVGLEFGQMFRRFGSRVTIVQRGSQLLAREDKDIADAVLEILEGDGIEVLLDASAVRAERADGHVCLTIKTEDGERVLDGSHLLVAVGRAPNTDDLHLDAAGVQVTEKGFVKINEHLETNVPGVYAIGDVAGNPAFTHISYDDFRILRDLLLGTGTRTTADRPVPYVVFIDPQLGRIGLGEDEARKAGRNVRVVTLPMDYVSRAIEVGETRGFMKAVVDGDSDEILGAAVLGVEGGEIMAMIEIAMIGHVPYTTLRDAVFSHPTLSESLNTLFMRMER